MIIAMLRRRSGQRLRIAFQALPVVFICALASFLCLSCGNGDWITFRGEKGSGRSPAVISPPVGLRWKILLQKHSSSERFFNQPLVVDGTIYFGSADGNFYSLDIDSGFMNWTFRSGGAINAVAYIDHRSVYFGSSDGNVYCLDRKTGEKRWEFPTSGGVNSTIVPWGNDHIVAAADSDAVYVLTKEGQLDFQLENQLWFRNSFQIFDGYLAFAPGSQEAPFNLAVYDMRLRRYRWSLTTGLENYPWFSFPAVDGRRLYYSAVGFNDMGQLQFKFSCLDFSTGEELWEELDTSWFSPDSTVRGDDLFFENTQLLDYSAPLLWRSSVIYAAGDQYLRAYSRLSGKLQWKRAYPEPIATAVTLAGDRLYFGLRSERGTGDLVCASASTGRPLWNIPVEGTILNSPVIAGKLVMFGTDEGYFYVFEALF